MNARNAADQILGDCLQECMQQKQVMIDEEMEQYEDYVFSDEFETGMKKLLVVRNKKTKSTGVFKYAVSMAATLLVVVGIVSASATSTKATLPSIDILGWFDTHFEFSKGTPNSKESAIIFDETQITYIPGGFVKVTEEVKFTYIEYKYENFEGNNFTIRVSKALTQLHHDNEEIVRESLVNDGGYECLYVEYENELAYIWEDSQGLYYRVYGNMDKDELNSVMNGIQYKGENK
ncbi:MAG: DUF4367 domain-containing protein [Lachnospiraceae bacterium]|nr:DUF4367 domain-containing protein [Lachnospiraceae bacterium]